MAKRDYKKNPLKVIELFAGVGGFRLGLEGKPGANKKTGYKVVWSNQFEPKTKIQHAASVFKARWGEDSIANEDINEVIDNDFTSIPDHDVLTGGFPCQDYSVAKPLTQSAGLKGKKGVLWWCIYEILSKKKNKPKYLILENVDRLLKSPADQRGRDFAIMLNSLAELGYAVEWRVINAADYGFPQRRRRVFIVGYHRSSSMYDRIGTENYDGLNWILKKGVMAKAFKVQQNALAACYQTIDEDPVNISNEFGTARTERSPFANSGIMKEYQYLTIDIKPLHKGKVKNLCEILVSPEEVDSSFYVNGDLKTWTYLKGAKNAERTSKSGHKYRYTEGSMSFPDPLDRPARTIVTGEGGPTPSRFKHVIEEPQTSKLRRLTPVELERLNGFPDNHTKLDGITDKMRAFFMGNALVVGVVEKIGKQLLKEINAK